MEQREIDDLGGQLRTWRREHPQATLTEIEAALDESMLALRARFLGDLASGSAARGKDSGAREQPTCPRCGKRAVWEGERERRLWTAGEQVIRLRRGYASCSSCEAGFFPPGRGVGTDAG